MAGINAHTQIDPLVSTEEITFRMHLFFIIPCLNLLNMGFLEIPKFGFCSFLKRLTKKPPQQKGK